MKNKLKNPESFANSFIDLALKNGFGSMAKRDIDLLIYYLLERDGAISRSATNHAVAGILNISVSKATSCRRDAYARWRGIFGEGTDESIKALLLNMLSEKSVEMAAKHSRRSLRSDGLLPLWIEHPIDRMDFERVILDAGGIPQRDNHPDVILVRIDVLIQIAEKYLQPQDAKYVANELKKISPGSEDVRALLAKDFSKIDWNDIRSVVNKLGAQVVEGELTASIPSVFRVMFKGF